MTASYARPRVVLASGNAGKVREFNHLLADAHIEVLPQSSFGVPEADEPVILRLTQQLFAASSFRSTPVPITLSPEAVGELYA